MNRKSSILNDDTMAETEARREYLLNLAEQLTSQMRVLKQVVATEVADLKGVMQQQVAEIKQIVMHQDRVYQERIRRLESRVEQLSEFAMHVARSSGAVATTSILPLDMVGASAGSGGGEGSPGRREAAAEAAGGDEDGPTGVPAVLQKYKDSIADIYKFYTHSNINVFHPTMSLPQFTKFLKDCKLCGFEIGEPAELLWMNVLRKLNVNQGKRKSQPMNPKNTTVRSGKYPTAKSNSFAFERLEEIPEELFGEALVILSVEKMGKERVDLTPEAIFETFLVCEVLPHIEAAMSLRKAQPAMQNKDITIGGATFSEYAKSPGVEALVKEYMGRIREASREAVTAVQDYREKTMNLDGFVEFARRHDLLPLISKPELRAIFEVCVNIEKKEGVKEGTLSREQVVAALYHLADRIYGSPLFVDKYPTHEARMQKLLTKMFLLKPKEPITESWKKI